MEGLTVTLIGSSFLPWLWALFTRRKWSKTMTAVFVLFATFVTATFKEMIFGNLSLSVFDPESFMASLGVILVTSQAIYTMFKESVQRVEGAAEIVRGGGSEGSVSTKEQLLDGLDGLGDMAKQLAAEQLAKQVNKVEKVLPHKTSRIDEAVDRNYDTLIKLQAEGKFDEMVDVLLNENIEIEELASLPEVFDDYESVPG